MGELERAGGEVAFELGAGAANLVGVRERVQPLLG